MCVDPTSKERRIYAHDVNNDVILMVIVVSRILERLNYITRCVILVSYDIEHPRGKINEL